MKKMLTAVMTVLTGSTLSVISAHAQESGAQSTGPSPVEAFYCDFQNGKSLKDLLPVAEKMSKWADQHDPSYAAWILTPQFGMDAELPDVIWLGSSPDGNAFGKGQDGWQQNGRDLQAAFDQVVDCSIGHVLASSSEISAPDGPPGDGVVMFTQCIIGEGSDWEKAINAHKQVASAMRTMGAKNSNWVFFPMLGGNNVDYDYLSVVTFKNWADFGAAYEIYVSGGGWQKSAELMSGVAECNQDTPTVWDVKLVHQGAQ